MDILGRIEAEAAFVGQLAGRPRNVLALSTVPLIQLVQLADGFRIGHPAERLCHGHEPDVIPAGGGGEVRFTDDGNVLVSVGNK